LGEKKIMGSRFSESSSKARALRFVGEENVDIAVEDVRLMVNERQL
jgi:hypothetical protein